MNWKLETSAGISPGANRWHKKIAEGFTLNVHASGRAVCRYHRESCTDPETGHTTESWHKDVYEYVDSLSFELVYTKGGALITEWSIPGDAEDPKHISMTNEIFHMDIHGGWISSKPCIKTKEGWDPLFGLMIGYLCAFEYSPMEIKRDLTSDQFPPNPNGLQGSAIIS